MPDIGALIQAIGIMRKYNPDIETSYLNAGHDQVWLPIEWEDITDEADKKKLGELGFFEDEGSVSMFT